MCTDRLEITAPTEENIRGRMEVPSEASPTMLPLDKRTPLNILKVVDRAVEPTVPLPSKLELNAFVPDIPKSVVPSSPIEEKLEELRNVWLIPLYMS